MAWGERLCDKRYVDMHWLIGFATCFLVDETWAETFDLYTSARLLLDVFDEHSLCIKIGIREKVKRE
jgi:hypothetical protein